MTDIPSDLMGPEPVPPLSPRRRPPPDLNSLQAAVPACEILTLIGQGGMGWVYRVRRRTDGAVFALKVVDADRDDGEAFAERFQREAETLTRLSHPSIVAIRAHGRSGTWCWLLMDLIEGANLRQVMRTGRLSPTQTLALMPPLCNALQYAHDQGVVHRDIKPENILIDEQGAPHLCDFGIAKMQDTREGSLTLTGATMGTVHYMAPEQVVRARAVDHRADIYALGVVFYELLTGELPLGRFELPSHRVAVDARVDDVVLKALERDPARRWQQASQIAQALQAIQASVAIGAATASADASSARPSRTAASAARAAAPVPLAGVPVLGVPLTGAPVHPPPVGTASARMSQGDNPPPADSAPIHVWGMSVQNYTILIHLAALCTVFGLGFILTLVMWLTGRDRHPAIDLHGRIAINWILSYVVGMILFALLSIVVIGIPFLIVLALLGFMFPIYGAIRAADGVAWRYPLSFPFLPTDHLQGTCSTKSGAGMGCAAILGFLTIGMVLLMGTWLATCGRHQAVYELPGLRTSTALAPQLPAPVPAPTPLPPTEPRSEPGPSPLGDRF